MSITSKRADFKNYIQHITTTLHHLPTHITTHLPTHPTAVFASFKEVWQTTTMCSWIIIRVTQFSMYSFRILLLVYENSRGCCVIFMISTVNSNKSTKLMSGSGGSTYTQFQPWHETQKWAHRLTPFWPEAKGGNQERGSLRNATGIIDRYHHHHHHRRRP